MSSAPESCWLASCYLQHQDNMSVLDMLLVNASKSTFYEVRVGQAQADRQMSEAVTCHSCSKLLTILIKTRELLHLCVWIP